MGNPAFLPGNITRESADNKLTKLIDWVQRCQRSYGDFTSSSKEETTSGQP